MLRALSLWVVLLTATAVRAENVSNVEAISDEEVVQRLVWIERSLNVGAIGTSLWWGGWMGYAAAEGAYGWMRYAHTKDRLDKDIWLVTGLGASLWVAQLLIFPMKGAYAPLRLKRMPRDTPEQRRLALKRAEELLADSERAERESLHWSEHVLDLAWAFGSTAYIFGRGYNHVGQRRLYRECAIELALTIVITEAAILSTPRKAIRDLKRYKSYGPSWDMQLSGTSVSWTLRF